MSTFETFKQRIQDAMNQAGIAPELEKQVRALVQSVILKLDLVGREEFDAQTKVLAHTRQRLESLEQQLDQLLKTSPQEGGDNEPPSDSQFT